MKKSKPLCVWFTGLSGAGKTTLGTLLKEKMDDTNIPFVLIDGDVLRKGLNKDLGYTLPDREENIRRASELTKIILNAGVNVICCFISPTRKIRETARLIAGEQHFVEVFVDASLEECKIRDPKGLYKKASMGQIKNVSGIDSVYEAPEPADIHVDTVNLSVSDSINKIYDTIQPLFSSLHNVIF